MNRLESVLQVLCLVNKEKKDVDDENEKDVVLL